MKNVLEQATPFILSCYGEKDCKTITEARQKLLSGKVARCIGSAPELASLPPTNEAFKLNVARAHYQISTWRQAINLTPPTMDPLLYGWHKWGTSLIPQSLP